MAERFDAIERTQTAQSVMLGYLVQANQCNDSTAKNEDSTYFDKTNINSMLLEEVREVNENESHASGNLEFNAGSSRLDKLR